jgi:hypothetical protein
MTKTVPISTTNQRRLYRQASFVSRHKDKIRKHLRDIKHSADLVDKVIRGVKVKPKVEPKIREDFQ